MLRIGGIEPFSTVDWPGRLCCVAFLAGCPWRCPYCQNHLLQSPDAGKQRAEDLWTLLGSRRGLLDGVVFSGGEPLAQADVVPAMATAQEMGFAVGLHTCGAYPERLAEALPFLDWVGLDVKAPWDAYERVTGVAGSGERAERSLELLLNAGIEFEARTTWHPDLLSTNDIAWIGRELAGRGVRAWAVQAYRHMGTTGELDNRTVRAEDVPAEVSSLFSHYEFR